MTDDFSRSELRIIEAAATIAAEQQARHAAVLSRIIASLVDSLVASGAMNVEDFKSRLRRHAADTADEETFQNAILGLWIDRCVTLDRDCDRAA